MLGAVYYHAVYTPLAMAIPALIVLLLCLFVIARRRAEAAGAPRPRAS